MVVRRYMLVEDLADSWLGKESLLSDILAPKQRAFDCQSEASNQPLHRIAPDSGLEQQ